MRRSRIPAVLMLAAGFLLAPAALAAVDAFIWFEDGSIKGDSKDPQHPGWIEISSFQIEQIRQAAGHANAAGGGAGKVSFQDLHITKRHDSASAKLKLAASGGTHYREVMLSMRKAGGDPGYLTVKLGDVTLSGYQGSADQPTESLTLNFTKIEWKYTPQQPAHTGLQSPALAPAGVLGSGVVGPSGKVMDTPTPSKSSLSAAQVAPAALKPAVSAPRITGASASAPAFGTNVTVTITSTGPCTSAFVDYGDGSIAEGHQLTGTSTQLPPHVYATAGAKKIHVGGWDAAYWSSNLKLKSMSHHPSDCTGSAPEVNVTLRSQEVAAPVIRR